MHLKKNEWEVTVEVENCVRDQIKRDIGGLSYDYVSGQSIQTILSEKVSEIVAKAVAEGIRVFIRNIYTQEQFEKDLTLRP